jgi:hypothetical protein
MYIKRNIVARSRNQSCRGKAISITYIESVSVVLVIQLTKRIHNITYIIICGVCGCTVLSHIISQREKKMFRKSY